MILRCKFFSRASQSTLLVAAVFFLFSSCDFDQGLGPSKTKIAGKVIFSNPALRPDSTKLAEVRVIAVATLPPSGFGDIYFSTAVSFRRDTADYEIALPVGTYPAVGVVWRPKGKNWSLTNLIGIYDFNPPSELALRSVQVTDEQPIANVNLLALWNFANFDGTVQGRITFAGNKPDGTEILLVSAFVDVPDLNNIANSLGLIGGIPLPLTNPNPMQSYEISVRNGAYKFIGVFWKGKSNDPKSIRCIGFYPDPVNSSRPGDFSVPPEGAASGIDFVADFSTLPEGVKLGKTQ